MATRLELHKVLCNILGSDHVYFQPPASLKIEYPCIVYQRSSNDTIFADNNPYRIMRRYLVVVIDKDPDSEIPNRIEKLQLCISDRFYTADNLNHFAYNLYF